MQITRDPKKALLAKNKQQEKNLKLSAALIKNIKRRKVTKRKTANQSVENNEE